MNQFNASKIAKRFNRHLPVVVDVETGGVNPGTDALLEIAICLLDFDDNNQLVRTETLHEHIQPFPGGVLDPESLKITQIDPYHPFRFAKTEADALHSLFIRIRQEISRHGCMRAYLVGHNAWFDLLFMRQAMKRVGIKDDENPFHRFTCLDTATLAGLAFGQTVLARAVNSAGIAFDRVEAHSAIYDAEKTADLFCHIVNNTKMLRRQRYQKPTTPDTTTS